MTAEETAAQNQGVQSPTLGDLFNPDSPDATSAPATNITDGDGTKLPDLSAEQAAQAAADEAQRLADEAAAAEATAEDEEPGSDEETEQESTTEDIEFYKTLDSLHGEVINENVDYGTADPMSPQGVFIREQYIANKARADYENVLKENDPRAYAYFLHRQNGGSDEEFYAKPSTVLPTLQEIKESVDLQRKVYQAALTGRGNTPKQVEALLKVSIDSKELEQDAEVAFKELKEKDDNDFRIAQQRNEQIKEQENRELVALDTEINNLITSGEALKFAIPEATKAAFSQEFKKLIHYEDGEFYLVKPVRKESLPQILEAELFNHLKGDLKKLVERKAATVSARRTLNKAIDPKAPPKAGSVGTQSSSLGSIL